MRAGADVIVNTDADNQYHADDIPKLTAPILAGEADLVIGARPIVDTPHFSRTKKALQLLGSMVVRMASRTTVVDAPSGFRALSREAALRLHVHGEYTYTLETIIAAGRKNMAVTSVPIRTNPDLRPSRLVRSLPGYVLRSARDDPAQLRDLQAAAPVRRHRPPAARGRRRARPALPLFRPRSARAPATCSRSS